jgi:hypothetical protein
VSELVEELQTAGYTHVQQLDAMLGRSAKAFEAYERAYPPILLGQAKKIGKGKYADVGVVRTSLSIADPKYFDSRKHVTEVIRKQYEEFRHLVS